MRTTLITISLLALAGCNQPWHAPGVRTGPGAVTETQETYPWTARSKWLCAGMVGAHYLDYETSRRLNFGETIDGGHFNELNPLLGDHPSDSDLALFKGGAVLLTVVLAEIWPEHRDLIFFCSGLSAGLAAGSNHYQYNKYR